MVEAYIIRAIIAIVILAINASIAGSFVIFKDISFLVAGAAHAALAGAALAMIFATLASINIEPMGGAIVFALFIAILAARAKKANIAIGIGFAASMSLAVLFISMIREQAARVWGLLFGDILLLTDHDIFIMASATVLLVMLTILFGREFIFISFDEEGAKANGIKVEIFNYLLLSIIAVSTVIIMKGVGAILAYAMLVAPAASANSVSKSISSVFLVSALIALLSGLTGLGIAFIADVSPGAVAALIATLSYILSLRHH